MKKTLLTILSAITLLLPLQAGAVNVSVPSAPALGSTLYGKANGNYATLTVGASGDCLKVSAGIPSWGSCGAGGGGGTDGNWSFFNGSGIRLATTSNQVLIGASATSTLAALEVRSALGILTTGSTTLQNFTFVNGTGTSATTTNFFSTVASSTNAFFSKLIAGFSTTTQATTTNFAITGVTSTILKTNTVGAVVPAVSGTDYQAAGTYVTAVSVASANGLAGSSSGGATPALTLSTSITGILKGNGTAISAASAGTDYEVPLTFSTGLTRSTNTVTVNTSQNIATLSNLTSNGFVKTSGGTGALSIDTNTYLTGNQSITLSGDVSGSGSTAITTAIGSNKVTVGMLAQAAANTVLGNPTGATGNIQAFATSSLFQNASATLTGLLSSTDWSTFNGKQASGNYITALTGDVTATGPNSVAATLATVNSNVGSFTNASITVNAKGLITAASTGSGGTAASSTLLSDNNTWTGNNTFAKATTTSLGITGVTSSILKTTSTGGVVGATNGTDFSLISALSCSAGNHLATVAANGTFTCTADSGSAGNWATSSSDYYNSQFRDWSIVNGALSPTTTKGIVLAASSTNANLQIVNGTTTNATTTKFVVSGITSALHLSNSAQQTVGYAGSSCGANTKATSISAAGVVTCSAVANADLTNSTISGISLGGTLANLTATDGTLTFSGTYTGATARTIGLNLGNANTWTALQTFQLGLVSQASSTITSLQVVNGTTTNATTTNLTISGISGSTQCLTVDTNGKVSGTGSACGSGSGGGGNSKWATSTDSRFIQPNGGTTMGLLIGTTTPSPFTSLIFASTTPVFSLTDTNAGTNQKHILIGNYDGRLIFGTSTDSLTSTSSGLIYDPVGSAALGIASSTPFYALSLGTGNGSSTSAILVAEHRPATSTSMTVNWANGNTQNIRIGNAAMTVTFSNHTDGATLKLLTCNPPTGTAGTITWGTEVLWAGGTAPTQTTTANKCDVWSFLGTQGTSTLKVFGSVTSNF